jgi:hypothetical protein
VYYFPEARISRVVNILCVLTSALLLVGAIAGLYSVHNPLARLGMIAGFTTLFAVFMSLFSNERRGEILAASAA